LQSRSIARSLAAAAAATLCLTAAAAQPRRDWQDAPEYVALFAPAAHAAAYRAYTAPVAPEALLGTLARDLTLSRPPGAWEPRLELPADAFGRSGRFDRAKLARLYGGRRVTTVRGPRAVDGRVAESWLLVSPYPDPSLQRLEAGTLILVLTLP
jgi:hypothetical protein